MTRSAALAPHASAGTDPGLIRRNNEDSGYLSHRLFAVADGMGGHAHGEVASTIAVTALAELDEQLPADLSGTDQPAALAELTGHILRRLTDLAARDEDMLGMGTTLVGLLWDGTEFTVVHIGDSRAYLIRDGECHQLTRDHTMVQSLLDEGRISAQQAATHPRRSMLMRALQANGTSEPDVFTCEVREGDRYLLCSDGLTDAAPVDEVVDALAETEDRDEAIARLIALAKQHGGPDNITCVIVDVLPVRTPTPDHTTPIPTPSIIGAAAQHAPEPRATSRWFTRVLP
jgi:PPM family protein phosphatase